MTSDNSRVVVIEDLKESGVSFYNNINSLWPINAQIYAQCRKEVKMKVGRVLSRENWDVLCEFIRRSNTLKCIEFEHIGGDARTTYEYLSSLFDMRQHFCCPLESIKFSLHDNWRNEILRRRHLGIVMDFLKTRPNTLWTLDLVETKVGDGCVRVIVDAMNAGVRIGVLKLPGESISDDEAESLLNANNSKHLQKLDFYGNKMSIRGIQTFATFLKKESTIIEELDIRSKEITSNIKCNQMLLGSVNSKMRYIKLGSLFQKGYDNDSQQAAMKIVEDLVCNTSDFNTLCLSNHQIYDLGYSTSSLEEESPNIKVALDINKKNCSVNQRCRSKLRALYFQGNFDMKPFIDLDIQLIPNLLELATMTDVCIHKEQEQQGRFKRGVYVASRNGHLGSIFLLVRNCHCLPELFSFPPQEIQMRKLKEENDALKVELARMKQLEEELASLRLQTELPQKRLRSE